MAEGTATQGSASRVGLILAFLTVVVSVVNGLPAYLALRGTQPHVVYEVERAQMLYPDAADRTAIQKLLTDNLIPDAFVSLVLSNRGDIAASEVALTIKVPGKIVADRTEPTANSKPAWVKISKDFDPRNDESRISYLLSDLGLTRNLVIKVSYISRSTGDPQLELFYDGNPGIQVADITTVPEKARAISFVPTLKILGAGLFLSAAAYLLLRFQVPAVRKVVKGAMAIGSWRRYKDHILLCVGQIQGAYLESCADGSLDASDPKDFWDGMVRLADRRLAFEVHTSSQQWPGFVGEVHEQRRYALTVHVMAVQSRPEITDVVIVNDDNLWDQPAALRVKAFLNELASAGECPKYHYFAGHPDEVVKQILSVIGDKPQQS